MCAKPFLLISLYVIRLLNGTKMCRLTVCFTHQSCTRTTMASFLALFVRTMIPWMSWLSCRYAHPCSYCQNFTLSLHACFCELYICLKALSCLTSLFVQDIQTWVALTTIGPCTTCVCCNRCMYIHAVVFMSVRTYVNSRLNPTICRWNNGCILGRCNVEPVWYVIAFQPLTGASSSRMLSSG